MTILSAVREFLQANRHGKSEKRFFFLIFLANANQ